MLDCSAPPLSLMDVQILFNKSEKVFKKAENKITHLHSHLVAKANDHEVRRICCMYIVYDVCTAMTDAKFEDLKEATESLQYVVQSNREAVVNDGGNVTRNSCSEVSLMDQFGGALRLVSTLRDTYNTNSCNVREEFRKDFKPLKAYENRTGFESEKMSLMIELL